MTGRNNDELKHWVWLSSLVNIPAIKRKMLLDEYYTPERLWNEGEDALKILNFLTQKMVGAILDEVARKNAEEVLKRTVEAGIGIITIEDASYPENLRHIFDPPLVLYSRGTPVGDEPCVALVGSRRATAYGLDIAELLSYQLSKLGITVVSGMARGIDSKAHNGAIKAGGRTIAVLGCGVDVIYPEENRKLMKTIIENGAVLSEYLPGMPPQTYNFPARNRIISGMSRAVTVVEASDGSGSLITADYALEQGREVFAVPGNINSTNSRGTNKLIRDGARIVLGVDDILEELEMIYMKKTENSEKKKYNNKKEQRTERLQRGLDSDEADVMRRISNTPANMDDIAERCARGVEQTSAILVMLELKGLVEQLPGRRYKLLQKLK
ncbi:MAG: DNA-protecting protein DprA [Clostridiales bacterium]|nr:DNA-protecting protein DprA [Clostridiales bacterium]